MGIDLEVDRTAWVLSAFQNVDHRTISPFVGVLRFGVRGLLPLPFLVGSGRQHLVRFELIGDLLRAASLHTHIKDTFDHSGSFFINDSLVLVRRVFDTGGTASTASTAFRSLRA